MALLESIGLPFIYITLQKEMDKIRLKLLPQKKFLIWSQM